jgi:hypothetical protein
MHMTRRFLTVVTVAVAIATATAYSETVKIDQLQKSADTLSESLASALPFNSTVGLNWSDAYLKQFPHFGVGLVGGFTTMDAADIAAVLKDLGSDVGDLPDKLPIPAMALEGRIGGFVLPFDIGFKFGFLPGALDTLIEDSSGVSVDYKLIGFDVRYAVLKGGGFTPKLSVGAGFNYLKGGVSSTVDGGQSFSFKEPNSSVVRTIEASDPEVGLEWTSKVIDFKAQVSWKFLIFVPYAGLGLSHGSSSAGYFIKSTLRYDDGSGSGLQPVSDAQVATIVNDLKAYNSALIAAGQPGFDIPDVSSTGIESSMDVNGWASRFFAGMSITPFPFVRLDLTGLYSFADGSYGLSLGTRIQF